MAERSGSENDRLDQLVSKLQSELDTRAREIYSRKVIELFENPVNVGRLEDPDGTATYRGPCGDTMEMYVRVKNGSISECTFMTDGCGGSLVSGSMTTQLALGKSVNDALRIEDRDILSALGGLPDEEVHCPTLAAETLRRALRNYLETRQGK